MIEFEIQNEHQQELGRAVAASAPPDANEILIKVTGDANKPRIELKPPMGLDDDVLLAIRKLLLLYKNDGNPLSAMYASFDRTADGDWDMAIDFEYAD
ncbi:MAG: hypothetical protein AB7K71_07145 [Polyangiaceae bacterium]